MIEIWNSVPISNRRADQLEGTDLSLFRLQRRWERLFNFPLCILNKLNARKISAVSVTVFGWLRNFLLYLEDIRTQNLEMKLELCYIFYWSAFFTVFRYFSNNFIVPCFKNFHFCFEGILLNVFYKGENFRFLSYRGNFVRNGINDSWMAQRSASTANEIRYSEF